MEVSFFIPIMKARKQNKSKKTPMLRYAFTWNLSNDKSFINFSPNLNSLVQIRVEGSVQKLSEEQSTAYFLSRPRESQMGAWTSDQSRPLSNRTELEAKLKEIQQRFSDPSISIPKPPHWGGFVLTPFSIEFWQGQSARLHDRFEYRRAHVDGPWTVQRLSP